VNLVVNHGARRGVEDLARGLYANRATLPPGRLTIKHYAPNEHLVRQQNLNTRQEQVLHAKNYVLTRHDGSCVVMTGSYNLDGQSHYRSNENLMVFEAPDTKFRRVLFDDIHEASDSEVSHYPAPRTEGPLSLGCPTPVQPGTDTHRT
jgi:phosphatidylserine/phosphatidylglycerophosphate/cardiolipin synthase-like enzyme